MKKETLQERLTEVFEIAKRDEKPFEFLRAAIDHLFDVFLSSECQQRKEDLCVTPCNSFWKTVVESFEWKMWEKEVARRMHEHNKKGSKIYTGVWDVDECRECGWISPEHWQDFIKFVRKIRN